MRKSTFAFGRAGRGAVVVLALVAGTLGVAAGPSAAAQRSCVTRMTDDLGHVKIHSWCNIKKVKYLGLQTGKNYIAIAQGRGPMTLTLTATETVSNTKSSSIDVSAGAVSSAVGFDVTRSRTKSMAGSWVVPRGKFGTLKAYPVYRAYSFKAYDKVHGEYMGKGVARKAIGYRYTHSAR